MNEVRVLGVPMDFGVDRRGVDMGPSAIRYGGLETELDEAGVTVTDDGDLEVPRAEERSVEDEGVPYLEEIERVTDRLAERVRAIRAEGAVPLVLGGDHSLSIGSVAGSADGASIGVCWFDAHADINTPETSPSGNVHGMSLAAILGRGEFGPDWAVPGVAEKHVAYVGLRSIDEREREWLQAGEMTAFTMADIDEQGIASVVEEALAVASDGTDGVHVSLDMDWVDPGLAPGVGTPVKGGVNYREAHAAMERVATLGPALRSMDVVEVNPILDEHNETASLAAELVASAFGKRIL